jgi:hypothetical protein
VFFVQAVGMKFRKDEVFKNVIKGLALFLYLGPRPRGVIFV